MIILHRKYILPLSDLVKLLWVVDDDLDSHLHLGLLQAEVQASNLSVDDTFYHAFRWTQKQHDQQDTQTKNLSWPKLKTHRLYDYIQDLWFIWVILKIKHQIMFAFKPIPHLKNILVKIH